MAGDFYDFVIDAVEEEDGDPEADKVGVFWPANHSQEEGGGDGAVAEPEEGVAGDAGGDFFDGLGEAALAMAGAVGDFACFVHNAAHNTVLSQIMPVVGERTLRPSFIFRGEGCKPGAVKRRITLAGALIWLCADCVPEAGHSIFLL